MAYIEVYSKEKVKKIEKERSNYKVTCKCGHVVVLARADRVLCTHCGYWVYKDEKTRFKYELERMMKNVR